MIGLVPLLSAATIEIAPVCEALLDASEAITT